MMSSVVRRGSFGFKDVPMLSAVKIVLGSRQAPTIQIHSRTAPRRSNCGRASITDSKRGKRTSSTELQRTVADQIIRLVRLDCPDDCGRAAATELSRAQ
jgi:hypothetical protein